MEPPAFAIAIMAAGKGTRLKSKRPKVLHEIGGRALLLHVIAAAKTIVSADHIYCIIGHEPTAPVPDAPLREHAAMTILTAIPEDPTGYGRVLRVSEGAAEVTAIV